MRLQSLSVRALFVRALAAFAFAAFTFPHPLTAQTVDASILGVVRDSAGGGMSGVTVTAKNASTGVEWSVSTTSTGRFALLQLPLGGP